MRRRVGSRSPLRSPGLAPACSRCFHRDGGPPLGCKRGRARLTAFGSAQASERRSVRILLSLHLERRHDVYQIGWPMTPGTIARLERPFDHFALPFADSAFSDGEPCFARRSSSCHCCRRFYRSAGNSDTLIRKGRGPLGGKAVLWTEGGRSVPTQGVAHIGCDAKASDTNSSTSLEFFGATTQRAPQVIASASSTGSLLPEVTMAAISGWSKRPRITRCKPLKRPSRWPTINRFGGEASSRSLAASKVVAPVTW